jgi:hypothetical protein
MVHYDSDTVLRELEAMTAIARVLGTLDQTATRERVMRWAADKFHLEIATSAPAPEAIGAPRVEQDLLNADEPNDLFEPGAAAELVRGKEPLDVLVRELAANFQRLAIEEHGA